MTRRFLAHATRFVAGSALLVLTTDAVAQPSPLDSGLWSFPSAAAAPASARSAAMALADRWLGTQPFDNPAAPLPRGMSVAGLLEHVSRQDLRADNRQVSEESAFPDWAGAWVSWPVGSLGVIAYASQPVLRLEDNAFTLGEAGAPVQPGTILSNGTERELRAGLALSNGWGGLRIGVAAEWVHRADVYESELRSGSPNQGVTHVDFSGDGASGQAGLTWTSDPRAAHPLSMGLGFRYQPSLSVSGEQSFHLTSMDSVGAISAERASGYEAGATLGYQLIPDLKLVAGGGMHSARDWDGFGVRAGGAWQWGVGGEYHDAEDPWTLRFGGGAEQERDVLEPRAGLLGLGLGWRFGHAMLDFGLLNRSIERPGKPTSFDDRLVVSFTAPF